jgi:SAM-dependent methyltransferase
MKKAIKSIVRVSRLFLNQLIVFRPLLFLKHFWLYLRAMCSFKKINYNPNSKVILDNLYPCFYDNTRNTYIEPTYFFQDTWAAKKIFNLKPLHHYDVGSSVKTMGIISQFVPVTIVDIRPLPVKLPGLTVIEGSITELPFENNSIMSLSSLCVVEHIGLGRYGDALDPFGSEKAIAELKRVLKWEGILLLT